MMEMRQMETVTGSKRPTQLLAIKPRPTLRLGLWDLKVSG